MPRVLLKAVQWKGGEELFRRMRFLFGQLLQGLPPLWQITFNTFGERLGYWNGGRLCLTPREPFDRFALRIFWPFPVPFGGCATGAIHMPKLQRYISEELVHFVGRGKAPDDQYSLLVHILRSGWLTHPPHNPHISGNLSIKTAARISTNEMYSPEVVCFCDIPLEDLHIHTSKYSRFGLSLSKVLVARQGGAPVLYLPCNTRVRVLRHLTLDQRIAALPEGGVDGYREEISLGELFDRMVPEYRALMDLFRQLIMDTRQTPGVPEEHHRLHRLLMFLDFRLLSYVKFFDHHLADDNPENFYMEREWRVVGNVQFALEDVRRILIPEDYAKRLRVDLPDFYGQLTFAD
jgi:hypothetical protein